MTKFKRGEKVRVYEYGLEHSGTIAEILSERGFVVKVPESWGTRNVFCHPKQCRRLIRKRVSSENNTDSRIKPRAKAQEHHRIGSKCTLPNCPEQHDPAPMEHGPCGSGPVEHWHKRELRGTEYERDAQCPVDSCSWGKDKTPPKPAPREWWVRAHYSPTQTPIGWECTHGEPLQPFDWIKVKEVLPDDKGEL